MYSDEEVKPFNYIRNLGGHVYQLSSSPTYDYRQTFCVAFLPGVISLHGSVGQQFFTLPDPVVGPEDLKEEFFDLTHLSLLATLHHQGVVNKAKAYGKLNEIKKREEEEGQSKILHGRYDTIVDILKTCDCGPVALKRKIMELGFSSDFVDRLDFREETPELSRTISALCVWWERYKEHFRVEGDQV